MPYEIAFTESPPLLRLTLNGFWDEAVATRFLLDVSAEVDRVLRAHEGFDTLIDAMEFAVQSGDIVLGFQDMRATGRGRSRGRTAIVGATALLRLQATRAVADETTCVFASEAEALAWLAEQRADAA